MRLRQETNIITSSKPKRTQQSNIRQKDMGKLLGWLRNNLYKSPIEAICREISCNARDANREVGKHDTPIKIKLPNKISKEIHFIDDGPGIDLNRMYDILINYGASTKNETNDLLGGFGLGAKTPYAYTDTFSIITVTEENGKHIKRHFNAVIDDSQLGRIDLNLEYETDEHTGTKIIIPVKSHDVRSFCEAAFEVTKYWKVRPEISGQDIYYDPPTKIPEKIFEGEGWFFTKRQWGYRDSLILIDDIPYEINIYDIDRKRDFPGYKKAATLLNSDIVVEFGIGELDLAISRDNIHFSSDTQEKIIKRLVAIYSEIEEKFSSDIKDFKYINDAEEYVDSLCLKLPFLKGSVPKWRNVGLSGRRRHFKVSTDESRLKTYHEAAVYSYELGSSKLKRHTTALFYFDKKRPLFINDCNLSDFKLARLIRYYIESNPDIKGAQVINFKHIFAEHNWKKNPKLLKYARYNLVSKLPQPPKRSSVKSTSSSPKRRTDFDCYFVDASVMNRRHRYESTTADKNSSTGGVYILTTHVGNAEFFTENSDRVGVPLIRHYLHCLQKSGNKNSKIYIIRNKDRRYLNKNWVPLEKAIEKYFLPLYQKYSDIDVEKLEDQLRSQSELDYYSNEDLNNILKCCTDKNSVLYKNITEFLKLRELRKKHEAYIYSYNMFKDILDLKPKSNKKSSIPDVSKLYKKIEQTYPLFSLLIANPRVRYNKRAASKILKHYIGLVENQKEK